MPQVKFQVSGATKWKAAIVEQHDGTIKPLSLGQGTATEEILGNGLAWFNLFARGQNGNKITVEIKKGDNSIVRKRTYTMGTNQSLSRAIQFNPDA